MASPVVGPVLRSGGGRGAWSGGKSSGRSSSEVGWGGVGLGTTRTPPHTHTHPTPPPEKISDTTFGIWNYFWVFFFFFGVGSQPGSALEVNSEVNPGAGARAVGLLRSRRRTVLCKLNSDIKNNSVPTSVQEQYDSTCWLLIVVTSGKLTSLSLSRSFNKMVCSTFAFFVLNLILANLPTLC